MASEIKFTQDTMKQFNVAKSFTVNKDRINAMNFSLDGETLISSSDDDSIVIYDCKEGEYVFISLKNTTSNLFIYRTKRTLFSKKYGVDLIHFIHGTEQVLHGSTKVDGIYF
jgi:COMPASS component SWD2